MIIDNPRIGKASKFSPKTTSECELNVDGARSTIFRDDQHLLNTNVPIDPSFVPLDRLSSWVDQDKELNLLVIVGKVAVLYQSSYSPDAIALWSQGSFRGIRTYNRSR